MIRIDLLYATTYPNVHTPGLQLNIQFRSFCICLLDPSNEVAKCDFISISFTLQHDLTINFLIWLGIKKSISTAVWLEEYGIYLRLRYLFLHMTFA